MKELFNIKNVPGATVAQPSLAIKVGEKYFSFAISDRVSKKITSLYWYACDGTSEESLSSAWELHPELADNYYTTTISFDYPQNLLLNTRYYNHEAAGELLKNTFGVNGASVIISEAITDWQLHNIYAVPKKVYDFLSSKLHSAKHKNQYSITILSANAMVEGGDILVDFRPDEFSVLVMNKGNFCMAQTFSYATPEDVIYYLLKIAQQFSLSQKEVLLQLSGLIDKDSALYKELYQYFVNISFRDAEWRMSPNDYPAHFFTSLNDVARCE
jgi:hypothetical protein